MEAVCGLRPLSKGGQRVWAEESRSFCTSVYVRERKSFKDKRSTLLDASQNLQKKEKETEKSGTESGDRIKACQREKKRDEG